MTLTIPKKTTKIPIGKKKRNRVVVFKPEVKCGRINTINDDLKCKFINFLDEKLIKEFSSWNKDHISAVKRYSSSSSEINDILLHNRIKQKNKSYNKSVIIGLDDALRQHRLKEKIHVYSGLSFTPESYMLYDDDPFIKVFIPCYMSTSTSESIANGFGNTEVGVRKNSKHVYVLSQFRENYRTYKWKYKKLSDKERKILIAKDTNYINWTYYETKKYELIEAYNKKWNITDYNTITDISWFKHVLCITVPSGSHGGYINHHSNHKENEFIIPRNSIIHVAPEPYVDVKEERVVWYGDLVYDGFMVTSSCNWSYIRQYSNRKLSR